MNIFSDFLRKTAKADKWLETKKKQKKNKKIPQTKQKRCYVEATTFFKILQNLINGGKGRWNKRVGWGMENP